MIKTYDLGNNRILYATNSPIELTELLEKNCIALPIYDESNTDLDWPWTDYALSDPDEIDATELLRIYQRMANEPWHILDTERLTIREMTVDDVDDFYRIYEDPSITEYMDPLYDDPLEEKAYTKGYIENIYKFYGYGLWTLVYKETGEIIGRAGISKRPEDMFPDLGFVIDVNFQGKGLAFEACSAILKYAKKELEFDTIQARVKPMNTASINLLKKLGFKIPHTPSQGYLVALRTDA